MSTSCVSPRETNPSASRNAYEMPPPSIEVAAEMVISLRYLQKVFTVRGLTCSHYISSLRLDHAARLIERRALMKTGRPLSDIAYACGFRDYTHFARGFRQRFGTAPGGVVANATGNKNARMRSAR